MEKPRPLHFLAAGLLTAATAGAGVGDPQVRTAHPWYPGELACSTFGRLFATQAEQYQRAANRAAESDEDKALASWFWRNTHYAHGEEGSEDLWGHGFRKGDLRTREYWTGLFAHGFGLCGTTHSQWTAEMEHLLGHGRGRGAGVDGHNSFEVFLTGGACGEEGRWALLDHDLSTVIFDSAGKRLLSLPEVKADWRQFTSRSYLPERQRGWLVCGLHPGDGSVYAAYDVAEYLAGYAGPPPMVHLRRRETLRRYLQPGLENGRAFVFWGRNYLTEGVPGPERSLTWVNQPEAMHGSRKGAGHHPGQARFANAVYNYTPDFGNGDYREGILSEGEGQVTFGFQTPYIIGATPKGTGAWDVYEDGCRNGLVLRGQFPETANVAVSVDRGRTWRDCGALSDGMDLTDCVKGRRQYFLRFGAGAAALGRTGLSMTTVCQVNAAVLPRLTDGENRITFAASHQATVSAGPNVEQARTHVTAGGFDTPAVTLSLASPHGGPVTALYAAAQMASGNPPDAKVRYHIDYSTDGGTTWQPLVKDWTVPRRGEEPPDFWSQSFCYGTASPAAPGKGPVQVRFHNDSRRKVLRAEAHLVHRTPARDATTVTFRWQDRDGDHTASHVFAPGKEEAPWTFRAGPDTRTKWVEFSVVPR